jgi:hypothetical protein
MLFFSLPSFSQDDKDKEKTKKSDEKLIVESGTVITDPINPLAPARAAFYSAVIPGLGQAYNKKYWKIPIIYAALGAGLYFYFDNGNEYDRYRDAYKRRLAGYTDDEFYGTINDSGLIEAQTTLQRNQEISLLVTIGIYVLNIIDANVDAHLLQFNVDDNLSFKPRYNMNEFDKRGDLGLTVNFKF